MYELTETEGARTGPDGCLKAEKTSGHMPHC